VPEDRPVESWVDVHIDETDRKRSFSTVPEVMDVVLVRWPLERQRREALARDGRARLLLVEGDGVPPISSDCFEDWIRVPADDVDVQLRIEGLDRRWTEHHADKPELDPDGVLRFGDAWAPLPPVEARLMTALLDRFGAVVSRDQLARSGWPKGAPGRNALDVHVLRLRRRITPLGLAIKTVRSRGYLLEPGDAEAESPDAQLEA
jgi:hypothetical protein